MTNYDWLEKKALRSVDQLRLWPDNPRLDPDEKHISIVDYTSDLISDNGEKEAFFKLIDSISSYGYIPADPIVVWQNEDNEKYYVAEGNRRILALKLLRNPQKAPRSIRGYIRKKADLLERDSIEKIKVCIAPTFEDCEWYINQRHANSSLQRPWSRLQQQRWIAELYDKYEGNIDKVIAVTRFNKGQLDYTLRILAIRDLALDPLIMKELDANEQEKIKSHRIPMTILERWFMSPIIREKWGIELDEDKYNIISNKKSFLFAYSVWLKYVIHRDESDIEIQINTRTITSNLDGILEKLPKVSFEKEDDIEYPIVDNLDENTSKNNVDDINANHDEQKNEKNNKRPLNKNPDRNQLVIEGYQLKTSNYKLDALFREFKQIPVYKYSNSVAASLRVFLDLAVSEYIILENSRDDICKQCQKHSFQDVNLKQRLEYLKKNKLSSKTAAYKVVDKLLNPSNNHSVDTLNNYVHGSDTYHTDRRFLNGFWDFLFPLFEEIIGIKEV